MTLTIKMRQQIALLLCIALAALIAITLIHAIWQWYDDWALTHQPTAVKLVAVTNTNADLIATIPDQHIFGQNFTKSGEVPITNLQLHVTGIVKVEGGQNPISKVYISIAGQPSKVYQSGDVLPDGVKIYDITTDTVILENSGRLEQLPLPREKLQFKERNVEEQF